MSSLVSFEPINLSKLSKEWKKWESEMKDPIFLGLSDGKKYNKLYPNRFEISKDSI